MEIESVPWGIKRLTGNRGTEQGTETRDWEGGIGTENEEQETRWNMEHRI
jgi:hypothetical protein